MISSKLVLVLSLTLLAVVLFNIAIYISAKRRNSANSFKMFGKMARRARNPWEEDQAKLDELARKVAELRENDEE